MSKYDEKLAYTLHNYDDPLLQILYGEPTSEYDWSLIKPRDAKPSMSAYDKMLVQGNGLMEGRHAHDAANAKHLKENTEDTIMDEYRAKRRSGVGVKQASRDMDYTHDLLFPKAPKALGAAEHEAEGVLPVLRKIASKIRG